MPSIRQRKTGLYEARLSFKGKYFSVYDRNLIALKAKITKKFKELKKEFTEAKTLAYTKKDRLTLEKWYNEWLENDKKPFVKQNTLATIEKIFKVHILPKLGKVLLKDLSKNIIQKYLNNIERSRTKEMIGIYFKACVTQAFKERYIDYNPFDTVRIEKKLKVQKRAFTAEEQKLLLNYLKDNNPLWYKIILCYLCLGCRRTELYSIKENNIKKGYVLIEGTKTENATRYVNITPEFTNILLNTIKSLPKIGPHAITMNIKKIYQTLNLDGTVHTLRHTFITNHFYLGTPAKQVQAWAGHSSIQMTMDVYTNLDPTIDIKEEKNKILDLYNNLYYYTD